MMFRQWKYGIGLAAVLSFLVGSGIPADASMQSQRQFEMQGEDGAGQAGERWRKVSGTIKKMKNVALNNRDQENLVIEVQSRHGRQRIVDLGNADNLQEIDLQKGDRITAWGTSMTIGDRQVFMARKLKANGKKIRLDRPELGQSSQQQTRRQQRHDEDMEQSGEEQQASSGQRRIKGEVVAVGDVVAYEQRGNVLEFDRDGFYVVEEPNGRQAHLLVAERMDPGFSVGDTIRAKVRSDGSVISISPTSTSNHQSQSRQSASNQSGSRWDREGNRRDGDFTRDDGNFSRDGQEEAMSREEFRRANQRNYQGATKDNRFENKQDLKASANEQYDASSMRGPQGPIRHPGD